MERADGGCWRRTVLRMSGRRRRWNWRWKGGGGGGGKYPVNTSCGIIDEALGVMAARGSPHQGGNQNPAERQREDKEPSRGAALTLNPPLLCADAS